MKIKILCCAVLVFTVTTLKAQLFKEKVVYPYTASIKTIYPKRSAGNKYWTMATLDTLGRIAEKKSYRDKQLMLRERYTYNDKNDMITTIIDLDINRPGITDTTRYEFLYADDVIVSQKIYFQNRDSILYKMVRNDGDSLLYYKSVAYHYVADKKKTLQTEKIHIARYQHGKLNQLQNEGANAGSVKETIYYEYDQNNRLRRRRTDAQPAETVMLGSPGNGNQDYLYKYDRQGRLIEMLSDGNGRKHKLATYIYE